MSRTRYGLLIALASACGILTPDEHQLALYVAPEKVTCFGPFERTCLQVRESPDDPWQLFYDSIEGFDWEAGFSYRIRVAWSEVSPVPADGSSRRYRLVRVLSKRPAG